MTAYPNHLSKIEAKIISKIIDRALERGYQIMVWDGDEDKVMTEWTQDRRVIKPEVAATELTILKFRKVYPETDTKTKIGAVMLVHGNEEDVISDMTDNDTMRELIDPISAA